MDFEISDPPFLQPPLSILSKGAAPDRQDAAG